MALRRSLLLFSLCLVTILSIGILSYSQNSTGSSAPAKIPTTPSPGEAKPATPIQGYSLHAEQREKAIAYSKANYRLYFIGVAYTLALLYFLMRLQWPVKFAQWAKGSGNRNHFLQALIFVPLFLITMQVMSFPVDYYGQHLEKVFGISVQSFGSWLWDWAKGLMVGLVLGTIILSLLYLVIRRSPKRWWFYFWLGTIPFIIFLLFLQPYVLEPLFNKFTPLKTNQPQLTQKLESVVVRAGMNIPESRMFEMDASTKVKALNAYVSGIGASKRVVVWDTTIRKMTTDQIAFVFGHEAGHYVLRHIPKMLTLALVVMLLLFYLGYRLVSWAVPRWQSWTAVSSLSEWGSLTLLLFFMTILMTIANPVMNGISRYYEHEADIYGLEVTHGLIPDAPQNAARAFQILGEVDLADPTPNEFIKIWLYNHPPLAERVTFALQYNPWAEGRSPEYLTGK